MKVYGIVGLDIHLLLTSLRDRDAWSASSRGRFNPDERELCTNLTGSRMAARAGMDLKEQREKTSRTCPESNHHSS